MGLDTPHCQWVGRSGTCFNVAMTVGAELGEVQETLLSTVYARAVESGKKHGLLNDPRAVEMVETIDYDFSKFDGSPTLLASIVRTLILDCWVREFLARHPAGTVVEVGAGLNSRLDRVDNGTVHWIDLDMPDSIALRREWFPESPRCRAVGASIFDETWVEAVKASPGPYFFVAEGVFLYFEEERVRQGLRGIARNFPGSHLAFDTAGQWLVEHQGDPVFKKEVPATFVWACDEPRELENWDAGLRLRESRTLVRLPREVRAKLPFVQRCLLPIVQLAYRRRARIYRMNLFTADL